MLISFDDSGTAGQVDAILDELKENNMRAAFFPTGNWAIENLDLIERMKEEGRIVGNHTQTHARLGELVDTDIDEFYSEIYPLEGVANTDPMLLRHPYEDGAYDEDVAEKLTDKDIQGCTWTADTHDWDGSTVDEMIDRLESGDEYTQPVGIDGVVLAHMSGAHSPELIDALADHLTESGIPYEKINP